MKYFFDTEFREGFDKPLVGRSRHIIDFISIGIVAEDGREYYAISNEFDITAAWNLWQIKKTGKIDLPGINRSEVKEYWLRENVLMPIWKELEYREYREDPNEIKQEFYEILDDVREDERVEFYVTQMLPHSPCHSFSRSRFKELIKKYGKSNKEIGNEIIQFTRPYKDRYYTNFDEQRLIHDIKTPETGMALVDVISEYPQPKFYAYFADYDWVAFCALFGKMVDLPQGFPYYCRDLKQTLDEKLMYEYPLGPGSLTLVTLLHSTLDARSIVEIRALKTLHEKLDWIKKYCTEYPKQTNEHNALADAKWNKKLFDYITKL